MAKVGDKYIIEIEEVLERNLPSDGTLPFDPPTRLYRIKGFNSLVFDEHGLSKLEKHEDESNKRPAIQVGDLVRKRESCLEFFVTSITLSGKLKGIDELGNPCECNIDEVEPTGEWSQHIRDFFEDTGPF